jgi:hypothetical protein
MSAQNNVQYIGSMLQFSADEYNGTNFSDKFGTYRVGLSDPTDELHELSDDENFVLSKFQVQKHQPSNKSSTKSIAVKRAQNKIDN